MVKKNAASQAAGNAAAQEMKWTTDSKHFRNEISSPRSRIGPICFAEFDFNAAGPPGRRFTRRNRVILESVLAGAQLLLHLVQMVTTSAAESLLGPVVLGMIQDSVGFGLDLLMAVISLRAIFFQTEHQKELCRVKLHPLRGKPLRDYLHAAIMLPAQELTPAADLMGVTVGGVSSALNQQAAMSKRGIYAVQQLIGDPHIRELEVHTLGQAIQKCDQELFQSEEGAEVVCTMLGKVVQRLEYEEKLPHGNFSKKFMTMARAVTQDVTAHPEWPYAHKAYLSIMVVLKRAWHFEVASQLVKPVVKRADSDPAALIALMECCMKHDKGRVLEKVSGELQKTQDLPVLLVQGKEGPLLQLLIHFEGRQQTQALAQALLGTLQPHLPVLGNNFDNRSLLLDILKLDAMRSKLDTQVEQLQKQLSIRQLKHLRQEARHRAEGEQPSRVSVLLDKLEERRRSMPAATQTPAQASHKPLPGLTSAAVRPPALLRSLPSLAAGQPATAVPVDAASAGTAAVRPPPDEAAAPTGTGPELLLAASSVPKTSGASQVYEQAQELRHLVQLLQVVQPQNSEKAADEWRQDTIRAMWLTQQLTLFVSRDFPAQARSDDPWASSHQLSKICEDRALAIIQREEAASALAPVPVPGHALASAAAPAPAAALTATGRSAARPHSAQVGNASPGVNMGRHTRFRASRFAPAHNRG